MRDWPSIAPGAPEDYYIVVNRYGEYGPAFAETDLGRADLETTISDLMSGQHCDPLRVVMFNTDADRAEDVSHAIAQEYCGTCRQSWSASSSTTSDETAS